MYRWYEYQTGFSVLDFEPFETTYEAIQQWYINHPLHGSIKPPDNECIAACQSVSEAGRFIYVLKEEVGHRNG